MFKRHDIKAHIVRQMTCWNVNLIAGFNESEGAFSMRYKRYEFTSAFLRSDEDV